MPLISISRVLFSLSVLFLNILAISAEANQCLKYFPKESSGLETRTFFDREYKQKEVVWSDDASFMTGYLMNDVYGSVRGFHSKKYDTTVYFTANNTFSGRKGREELIVDPEAEAVVIFIHGSGTVKSGGRNFIGNMNKLASWGFSAISLDMPFHSNGSFKDRMHEYEYFMTWLESFIKDIKAQGKPVYLSGHSFGPDPIFEIISRKPHLVSGALAVSPAGWRPELREWIENYTYKMNFGGSVLESKLGGAWANIVDLFKWPKGIFRDPTEVNPDLKLRILFGNLEEYLPGPIGGPNKTPTGPRTYDAKDDLQGIFKKASIIVEEGVGHYIFDHVDKNGFNVFDRELLALLGYKPQDTMKTPDPENKGKYILGKLMKRVVDFRNAMTETEILADWYEKDFLFQAWLKMAYGKNNNLQRFLTNIIEQSNNQLAKKILREYDLARKTRVAELEATIKATKETDPKFYEAYKDRIEKGGMEIYSVYLRYKYHTFVSP